MAAVTLQDVAVRAGVSQATASRVLNGSARIPGEDVADRVRAAARELGYVPNAQAQALARASTGLLGLIVHDIADPYFSSIVRGVQAAARAAHKQVLLASTDRDFDIERESVSTFIAHRADAIVLAGSRQSGPLDRELETEFGRYRANGGRVVVIGQPLAFGGAVEPENYLAAAELADALIAAGHRQFAVIGGPGTIRTAVDRRNGFVDALGRTRADTAGGGVGRLHPRRRIHRRASVGRRPGADSAEVAEPVCVFAVTDVMAIGAIAAWRELGLGGTARRLHRRLRRHPDAARSHTEPVHRRPAARGDRCARGRTGVEHRRGRR